MKTIEEGAAAYAASCTLKEGQERTKKTIAFIAGANFAQQWISVEDELPKDQISQRSLVKVKESDIHGNVQEIISLGLYDYGLKEWLVDFPYNINTNYYKWKVTHWRPIERPTTINQKPKTLNK
jgi:hypothetical protein